MAAGRADRVTVHGPLSGIRAWGHRPDGAAHVARHCVLSFALTAGRAHRVTVYGPLSGIRAMGRRPDSAAHVARHCVLNFALAAGQGRRFHRVWAFVRDLHFGPSAGRCAIPMAPGIAFELFAFCARTPAHRIPRTAPCTPGAGRGHRPVGEPRRIMIRPVLRSVASGHAMPAAAPRARQSWVRGAGHWRSCTAAVSQSNLQRQPPTALRRSGRRRGQAKGARGPNAQAAGKAVAPRGERLTQGRTDCVTSASYRLLGVVYWAARTGRIAFV